MSDEAAPVKRGRGRPRKTPLEMTAETLPPPPRAGRTVEATEEAPRAGRLYRKTKDTADRFAIPLGLIPQGFEYQWVRGNTFGKSDQSHVNDMMENHWKPVPQARHPKYEVEKDGMILMERPKYLSDEARQETFDRAQEQLQIARRNALATPENQAPRKGIKFQTEYATALAGGVSEERK